MTVHKSSQAREDEARLIFENKETQRNGTNKLRKIVERGLVDIVNGDDGGKGG